MNNIKYILVNDSSSKNAAHAISNSKLPGIGQSIVVEEKGLIDELCRLRKQYPKAKILGVSELGERCVHPSERMNQLRRELSDLR